MSLVNIINLSLGFVGKDLLDRVGFQVESGDRVGLVGSNGSGKTSLLRLITGEISPDRGEVRVSEGVRICYLPQDVQESMPGFLLDSVLDSVPERVRLRTKIKEIEQALKNDLPDQEQERLAARLAEVHQDMGHIETAFPSYKAEKILLGLGFKEEDFTRSISSLSGGWKMRASLGNILYQDPDLMLLDEPTNHLDIPSVRWMEQFLGDYKGAMVLVCHDRDFLNRQINRVISLEPEGLRTFKGNYDAYVSAREEEIKIIEAKARNQEMKVKEAKRFIERFRAKASKARQAQSKIKLLEKQELIKSHTREKRIRFRFPEVPRGGRITLSLKGISKAYNRNVLYKDIDLSISRGERVAVVGHNGAGKTTLLRIISGEIKPDRGESRLGHEVTLNYYAQHQSEALDPNKTILEEVYQVVPYESISTVRGICGAFLFSGESVDKPIRVLSGGERARVCLAKILVKPGNFMVMDEPTNHLDLFSSEILIDALIKYNGTMLFVSHNQSFVNRLATKIWDIRDGVIVEYPGTLYEYYDHLARIETSLRKDFKEETKSVDSSEYESLMNRDALNKKVKRKERAEIRRKISEILQPIEKKLADLEECITVMEEREKEIENQLVDPEIFKDESASVPLLNEYNELREKLKELMIRWEYHHDQLEKTKRELDV